VRTGDTGIGRKVSVGRVIKPVGLKGGLKVRPETDNPERYEVGGALWLDSPDTGEPVRHTITSSSEYRGFFKITLDGISSVEEADKYRDAEIYVPLSEVPPLPEGEFYHFQIIGLEVFTAGGRSLGTVQEIITAGEKDVYVVRGAGKEYLIPVTEEHVREISPEKGRIDLYPMEGYLPE